MNKDTPQGRGKEAEQQACKFLQKQGLRLLEQNYSCRLGELDLIMQESSTLVFVEVKYRHSTQYGQASETVDLRKQRKIILTAQYFLHQHSHYSDLACRFDVVSFNGAGQPIEWLPNAFY